MRSAVLVHGCDLGTRNWNKLVWGEGVVLGRLPIFLKLFIEEKPDVVVFGSGGSYIEDKPECLVTYNHLLSKWSELCSHPYFSNYSYDDLDNYIKQVSILTYLDSESKNTQDELNNFKRFISGHKNISKIFLISNPFHLPRCLYLATKTNLGDRQIYAVPAQTDLERETFILEPAHKSISNFNMELLYDYVSKNKR